VSIADSTPNPASVPTPLAVPYLDVPTPLLSLLTVAVRLKRFTVGINYAHCRTQNDVLGDADV
jgi:hypothetical protein